MAQRLVIKNISKAQVSLTTDYLGRLNQFPIHRDALEAFEERANIRAIKGSESSRRQFFSVQVSAYIEAYQTCINRINELRSCAPKEHLNSLSTKEKHHVAQLVGNVFAEVALDKKKLKKLRPKKNIEYKDFYFPERFNSDHSYKNITRFIDKVLGQLVFKKTAKKGVIKLRKNTIIFDDTEMLYSAALDLAQDNGWTSIKIIGDESSKSALWIQAKRRGIKTIGYKPNQIDLTELGKQPLISDEQSLNHQSAQQDSDKEIDEKERFYLYEDFKLASTEEQDLEQQINELVTMAHNALGLDNEQSEIFYNLINEYLSNMHTNIRMRLSVGKRNQLATMVELHKEVFNKALKIEQSVANEILTQENEEKQPTSQEPNQRKMKDH